MKGYVVRTTEELERNVLQGLIRGLDERITFLGDELMELEEEEFDFRVKEALAKEGYNYLDEEYSSNELMECINAKKTRIIKELEEAKDTYEHVNKMLEETY
jgi:hypothetical protein